MHHPAVQFVAPYRIYIPNRFFTVKMVSGTMHVKAVPLPPIQSIGASQIHGSNVEIIHDVFGFAGRTNFYILLDDIVDVSDPTWKKQVCDEDHTIVDLALRGVNRLLEVYRDRDVNRIGVRSFHVLQLVRGDLSDVRLVVVDDDLNQVPEFAVTWPGFRSVGFGEAVLRDDAVTADIEDFLKSNTAIPIDRELLTSARNHLWRGQFRLVPIEANTAFEIFAFTTLMRIDPTNALPDSSDMYTKLAALQTAISITANRNAKTPVVWFDPLNPGWKGLTCPELLRWYSDCYLLRNRIIHRGYTAVQEVEAKVAIEATVAGMRYVDDLIVQIGV